MGLFTALTALGSFMRIPFFPVPLTLQSFFPLLAGCFFSPMAAAATQIAYLCLGLAGLPVFNQGGGIMYVLHPTFGYLLAMPVTAALVSFWVRRDPRQAGFGRIFRITFSCGLFLLLIGSLWLYVIFSWVSDAEMTPMKTIWLGMIIFIPAELLKAIAASFLTIKIQHRIKIQTGGAG